MKYSTLLLLSFPIIVMAEPVSVQAEPISNTFCGHTSMRICGITFTAQPGPIGTLLTFHLPEKYVIRTATVQCIGDHGRAYYKLLNDDVTSCALRTCRPGAVTLCNTSCDIPVESHIGDVVETKIPPEILIASAASSQPGFSSECRLVNGIERYQVTGTSGVSCNAFPCQPATLTICGEAVAIPTASEMGAVLQAVTNNNQPVTVQCIGSGGNRPTYQITDSSAVTCEE